MLKAILLDLDGTLLANPMETFIPAYLAGLGRYLANHVAPERLVAELLCATRAMDANDGSDATNQETFAAAFFPALGVARQALEPAFARFYAEEFPRLKALTTPVEAARPLVRWAFERSLQVAIATNPLFPRTAIEQRLAWAGVPVEEFPYALVTTYEDMHATKSNPAYYREILARLGREPHECLMAGDDWDWDIRPALELGLHAWWVAPPDTPRPAGGSALLGQGSLEDLLALARAGGPPAGPPATGR
ncbi:MAG: HAD family hydrolase [Acidobacteriota bacterium]